MEKGIEIACEVAGHEGEQVVFKRAGWKFRHLREWQEALLNNTMSVGELAAYISERIESWTLTGDDGKPAPFHPGPQALDDLPAALATFCLYAFRRAYYASQEADPNA